MPRWAPIDTHSNSKKALYGLDGDLIKRILINYMSCPESERRLEIR